VQVCRDVQIIVSNHTAISNYDTKTLSKSIFPNVSVQNLQNLTINANYV